MKKNNKGFTLAELLIVVAIIAVLLAISIPVFTTRLERSRETTDMANLRAAYAVAMTAMMQDNISSSKIYYNPSNVANGYDAAGTELGKGTAINGGASEKDLPAGCSYNNAVDVANKKIAMSIDTTNSTNPVSIYFE